MMSHSSGTICSVGDLTEYVGALPVHGRWTHWWFLGQADAQWEPVPSALRESFRESQLAWHPAAEGPHGPESDEETLLVQAEQALNREFRIRSAYLLPSDIDLVDVYFLARHHGLPSRLLDWTENPLLALFLAVTAHHDRDGQVLIASPQDFQTDGRDERAEPPHAVLFSDARSRAVRNTVEFLFGERSREQLYEGLDFNEPRILPIVPDQRQGRLVRQGARFTLHMPGCPTLSKQPLRPYIVPAEAKPRIRQELRRLAIRWDTFFPDLDHIARELTET